jgi:hypothetical protein
MERHEEMGDKTLEMKGEKCVGILMLAVPLISLEPPLPS